MTFPPGGWLFDLLPLVALIVAVAAYRIANRRAPSASADERVVMLEEQVRGLLYRVWTLERNAAAAAPPEGAAGSDSSSAVAPGAVPVGSATQTPPLAAPEGAPVGSAMQTPSRAMPAGSAAHVLPLAASPHADTSPPVPAVGAGPSARGGTPAELAPASGSAAAIPLGPELAPLPDAAGAGVPRGAGAPPLDLEQRIGARWATWVGIVALLVAVSLFLKYAFDSELLGPGTRVALGTLAGVALLLAGLALGRRRDVPLLSEALAGLGLGVLYLSLWAAHALYGFLGPSSAFAAMLAVTIVGAAVAIVSSRQITAALAVLGGLLTPVLLRVAEPDERNLLVYLLLLDFLVLAVARFRSWPALNRLAWAGSALLFLPLFLRQPDAPNPLSRLVLLSGLFLLFVAVPLLRERAEYRRIGEVDLLLVVGNAAGYFWVVYATLQSWHPLAAGPYALALAIVYRAAAADYATRVPDDAATVTLHEGIAWTFLTIAIPLALDGRWVTLAWAVQGVVLLRVAGRVSTPVAAWGGLVALLAAALRAAGLDRYWYPDATPVWNLTFLVHLLVVAALAAGGRLAGRLRAGRAAAAAQGMQSVLWLAASLLLALLFWREPSGLWPATWLTALVLVLGALARVSMAPAFAVATPTVAAIALARVFGPDDLLARLAASALVSAPVVSRVAACLAAVAAGGWLRRSHATSAARTLGRVVASMGAIALLFALSVAWTRYQDVALSAALSAGHHVAAAEIRWRTQVGLSVLWTLCASVALAWGFLRSAPAARYGALALFGLTVVKVFAVDLSAVRTAYRILSFLVLGIVLVLVGVAYQKVRRPQPDPSPRPAGS